MHKDVGNNVMMLTAIDDPQVVLHQIRYPWGIVSLSYMYDTHFAAALLLVL